MFNNLYKRIREFIIGPAWSTDVNTGKIVLCKDFFKDWALANLEQQLLYVSKDNYKIFCSYNHSTDGIVKYLKKEIKRRESKLSREEYHLYKLAGILPEGMK